MQNKQNYTIRITLKANKTIKHIFVLPQYNKTLNTAIVAFNKLARSVHKQYASSNLTTSAYIYEEKNNADY